MKKVLVIVATIIAVVLIGNVLIVSAQGGTLPGLQNGVCPNGYTCPFSGTPFYRGGMMAAGGMHQQVWTAVATKLGMTYDELNKALWTGQTIAQLAQAKGVSLNDLKQAALAGAKTALADLVKQGVMTQQQADWMLDHMDDMPMFNFGPGIGPGMMGGWQNGAQSNGFHSGPGMMGGGRGMMGRWAQPTGPQG